MPAKKSTKKSSKKTSAKRSGSARKSSSGFTKEERAAMRERAKELKSEASEKELLEKIAEMPKADRVLAERLHELVKENAPTLEARTWYGMPAYAKEGKVLCFFQAADKFKARYATLGFNDPANLDDGLMWPTAFALTGMTKTEETKIAKLIKKAVR